MSETGNNDFFASFSDRVARSGHESLFHFVGADGGTQAQLSYAELDQAAENRQAIDECPPIATIVALADCDLARRILVLAPAKVVGVWKAEFEKFADGVGNSGGPARSRNQHWKYHVLPGWISCPGGTNGSCRGTSNPVPPDEAAVPARFWSTPAASN